MKVITNLKPGYSFVVKLDPVFSFGKFNLEKNFDWVEPLINDENFPKSKLEESSNCRVMQVLKISDEELEKIPITLEDAEETLKEKGFRPADAFEAAAFYNQHPDVLELKISVLALGSVWTNLKGDRFVPKVSGDHLGNYFQLNWANDPFPFFCNYLAVEI
jgi:hypothetical protein